MNRKSLQEWLKLAYEDRQGCPPPEVWLEAELAEIPNADRERLQSHADSCARCAAERELAASFDRSEIDLGDEELRSLIGELEQTGSDTGSAVSTLGSNSGPSPWTRLALAAMLVLVAGLVFQLSRPEVPPLPGLPVGGVTRSGNLDLLRPVGEVATMPLEMSWNDVEGATRYRVVVSAVDGATLWETTTPNSTIRIPDELRSNLRPAVSYRWMVEALDASDISVGRSDTLEFRIDPTGLE